MVIQRTQLYLWVLPTVCVLYHFKGRNSASNRAADSLFGALEPSIDDATDVMTHPSERSSHMRAAPVRDWQMRCRGVVRSQWRTLVL